MYQMLNKCINKYGAYINKANDDLFILKNFFYFKILNFLRELFEKNQKQIY